MLSTWASTLLSWARGPGNSASGFTRVSKLLVTYPCLGSRSQENVSRHQSVLYKARCNAALRAIKQGLDAKKMFLDIRVFFTKPGVMPH